MKIIKKLARVVMYVLLIPTSYILVSLILTFITVNKADCDDRQKEIYIATNGVHLDIVVHIDDLSWGVIEGVRYDENVKYFSFGWGDENFYLNTPTWSDLTFKTAFKAAFLKSPALIHLTKYRKKDSDWVKVNLTKDELVKMNQYLSNGFKRDVEGKKIILENKGYSNNDNFYKANGSYSCLLTCNTWINTAFKESGLKACCWTPFDFGLLMKYE